MFMRTVSAMAIAAVLGFAPIAIAQAQTSAPATPPATTEPTAQPEPASPTPPTAQAPVATPDAADTAMSSDTPVDGQITMQTEGTYLGTDLLNTTVYSSTDENIGDVNDIIIGTNGAVEGVVVGVGGFLGIGEKDIALKLDQVKMVDQGDNTVKLVVSSTKSQLENAPAFKTVAELRQERDAQSTPAMPGKRNQMPPAE